MDNIEQTAKLEQEPVTRKTWSDFRNTGLLTMANTFLHIFGWAIVVQTNDDGSEIVYPARTVFRGFSEQSQSNAYAKLTAYMVNEAPTLMKEVEEG